MAAPKGHERWGGRKPGTPNKATASVKELSQQYTDDALQTLVEIMRSPESPPAARVAACKEILDRGHGKPAQAVEMQHQGIESWLDAVRKDIGTMDER